MGSRYFGYVGDEIHDFFFKKLERGHPHYLFKLGPHEIAQVIDSQGNGKWSCIVSGPMPPIVPRLVNGFSSRRDAVEYALKTHHLTRAKYNR